VAALANKVFQPCSDFLRSALLAFLGSL